MGSSTSEGRSRASPESRGPTSPRSTRRVASSPLGIRRHNPLVCSRSLAAACTRRRTAASAHIALPPATTSALRTQIRTTPFGHSPRHRRLCRRRWHSRRGSGRCKERPRGHRPTDRRTNAVEPTAWWRLSSRRRVLDRDRRFDGVRRRAVQACRQPHPQWTCRHQRQDGPRDEPRSGDCRVLGQFNDASRLDALRRRRLRTGIGQVAEGNAAFDTPTGQLLDWYPATGYIPIVVDDDRVILGRRSLVAVDAATGQHLRMGNSPRSLPRAQHRCDRGF